MLEQCIFDAVEADEGRILFAFFEVIGAGIDAVVQFRQPLRGRCQTLVNGTGRQVQRLRLRQVAAGNCLIQRGHGFDQRAALSGQIHAELR